MFAEGRLLQKNKPIRFGQALCGRCVAFRQNITFFLLTGGWFNSARIRSSEGCTPFRVGERTQQKRPERSGLFLLKTQLRRHTTGSP